MSTEVAPLSFHQSKSPSNSINLPQNDPLTQNSKDLLSNRSNLGSIESSLKSNSLKTPNPSKSIASEHKKSQASQKNLYEWEAVYIEGKFYLSDRETIQRYYDIEKQLKLEKIAKHASPKNSKVFQFQKGLFDSENPAPIQTSERLLNLETIKFKDESQSQKQKQEDESLLNNLDTSSQNCSRLTFEIQTPESQESAQPLVKRIDSISSIGKSEIKHNPVKENDQIIQKEGDELENLKQRSISIKKSTIKHSLKHQSQYGYYLGTNNQKVYSKKSENHDIQDLQSFQHEQSAQNIEDHSRSKASQSISKDSEAHRQSQKTQSLKLQQKIQLPINLDTNRLKISSPFSSISSLSRPQKQVSLHKITEEVEQDHKKSKIQPEKSANQQKSIKKIERSEASVTENDFTNQRKIPLPMPSQISLAQEKRFNSLSLKFSPQSIETPTRKVFQTYENIKSKSNKLENKNDSFFSNYEHINLVDSAQNEESSVIDSQMLQNKKNLRTAQLLSKFSELSKKEKLSQQYQKKDSGFLRLKKPHLQASKKYELPKIVVDSEKKSNKEVKSYSIDQKYHLVEKDEQFKLFEKANQINSQNELQRSKTRLNGFIKNLKNGSFSALKMDPSLNSPSKVEIRQIQNERKSNSKISRSIRSRSSFMTRNYKAQSPYQNEDKEDAQVFEKSKIDHSSQTHLDKTKQYKKSDFEIGKIKMKEGGNENREDAFLNNEEDQINQNIQKRDTGVEANLISDIQPPAPLNPEIKSLRENKQFLLEKLQNLEKQDLRNQINLIKQSIKQIEIQKLNKMAKTIDLSDHENSVEQLSFHQNESYQRRLKEILSNIPEQIQKINKPTQIAEIKVPEQIIESNNEYKITPNMTPEQLQNVAIKVYKLFGIEHDPFFRPPSLLTMLDKPELSFKQREKLLIKKFKNCVFFDLVGGQNAKFRSKTIVWSFSQDEETGQTEGDSKLINSFYIGGWSQPISKEQTSAKINQKEKNFGRGKKNGYGLEINQKFIYEGQYFNGKKHGEGKLYLIESGYRYEGQFIENHKSGHGKQFNPFKNQIYVGQFKLDRRHGKGYLKKIVFKNQKSLQKIYQKGGPFPYFFNGIFINGSKENGHEFFENGDQYKGEYSNQMLNGKGIFKWLNGAQYDGEFSKNFKQGFGKWSSAPDFNSGAQVFYIGEFKMNKKDGEGKYIYKNGAYYQGSFENDLKHGSGALFYEDQNKNSKVLRGYWKQGNIVANQKGQIYKMKVFKDEIQITT